MICSDSTCNRSGTGPLYNNQLEEKIIMRATLMYEAGDVRVKDVRSRS